MEQPLFFRHHTEDSANCFGQAAIQEQEQLQFVLPLYAMAVFAPFSLVNDYVTARSLWMTLLEAGVLGTIYLSTRLVRKRKPLWLTISLLVFALFRIRQSSH